MALSALVRSRKRESGTSVTETALLLPIILTILFFALFFWDVSKKRIKTLEVARFAAWEQTAYQNVLKSPGAIASETKTRYDDLDGTTPTGTPANNKIDFNKAILTVSVSNQSSVTDQNVEGMGGLVSSAVGGSLKPIFSSLVGSNRMSTLSVATVTLKVENLIVPKRMGNTEIYSSVFPPFLEFKATNAVIFDSWDAWRPGDSPANSQNIVRQRILDALKRSNGIVAFPGLGAIIGDDSIIGQVIDPVMSVLGLPWALSIGSHYVQMTPRTLTASITGANPTSAAMPGRLYEGSYWTGNGTLSSSRRDYKYVLNKNTGNGLYGAGTFGGGNLSNRHARAEECRGYFWDGSQTQQAEFYNYLIDNNRACTQSSQPGYGTGTAGTRRGFRVGSLRVER